MKIQCDVCEKNEASLFCVADEAALCDACDRRVHRANKLAGKHQRFSFQHPSPKQGPPLCDICQERRAFLFCQQDRAILCRQCDIPIHNANEHTRKHTRFLLTGVQLSAKESSTLTNINSNTTKKPEDSKSAPYTAKGAAVQSASSNQSCDNENNNVQMLSFDGSIPASSVSEYMEMLPGWHLEDFLDSSSSSPSPHLLSKNFQNGENELPAFWEHADYFQSFPGEEMGISNSSGDNSFAVPRISPHSSVSNRSTYFY